MVEYNKWKELEYLKKKMEPIKQDLIKAFQDKKPNVHDNVKPIY